MYKEKKKYRRPPRQPCFGRMARERCGRRARSSAASSRARRTAATRVEAVSSAIELVVIRRWARLTEAVLSPGFAELRRSQAQARESMSTLRLSSAAFDGEDAEAYRAAKRSTAGELPPLPQRPPRESEGWRPGVIAEVQARGGEVLAGTSQMRAARIMGK